jgi:phosphopantothenoylcysteine decarboxylase/phosphopantothenate--cysteine ligase
MLKGKEIVLGVTGGIAAYKAVELLRLFTKAGAKVRVVMTREAKEFVAPLTFQTLSMNPVYTDMFSLISERDIGHISLADRADLLVIAPATANIIGKLASGIADDLLTTTVMATKAPVLIAPAMNVNMYRNSVYRENEDKLRRHGFLFVEPAVGMLAGNNLRGVSFCSFAQGPCRGEYPGNGGPDPRRARSGPFYQQPFFRKDGLRTCQGGF